MKINISGKPEKIKDYFGNKIEALLQNDQSSPYLEYAYISTIKKYNPDYGDTKVCKCGHTYERHFDPWDDYDPCTCKYCQCKEFVPID